MRSVLNLVLAVVIAAVVGIGSAWMAVDRGRLFGAVTVGVWSAWPAEGGPDADPYALAMLARTGEVPLGAGEGLSFTADEDADGDKLSGRCTYEVVGETPAARLWTLTAYDDSGRLMVNIAHRPGYHSREIVRRPDGSFIITVSAAVHSGNWLPVALVDRVRLVLRLYDTPLTTGSQIAGLQMPAITKAGCP